MSHVRRVLACTDFSPAAGYPVDRATLLCRDTGAALELFHAVNLSGLNRLRRPVTGIPNGLGQRAIDDKCEEITLVGQGLSEHHGLPVDVHVATGPTFVQIEKRADDLSADLVVLGAHGTNTLAQTILPSTAGLMAEPSAFPVLIMKQEPRGRYRIILVPVVFGSWGTVLYPNTRFLRPLAGVLHVAEEAMCPDGIWHGGTRREKGLHPRRAARSYYARMTAEEMMGQQPSWPSMRVTSSRNRVARVSVRSAALSLRPAFTPGAGSPGFCVSDLLRAQGSRWGCWSRSVSESGCRREGTARIPRGWHPQRVP